MTAKTTSPTLSGLSGTIETKGDLRHLLSNVCLALTRREIKPDEAIAVAKVADAITRSMEVEIKVHLAAQMLREKGVEIHRLQRIGQMKLGLDSSQS